MFINWLFFDLKWWFLFQISSLYAKSKSRPKILCFCLKIGECSLTALMQLNVYFWPAALDIPWGIYRKKIEESNGTWGEWIIADTSISCTNPLQKIKEREYKQCQLYILSVSFEANNRYFCKKIRTQTKQLHIIVYSYLDHTFHTSEVLRSMY